MAGSGEDTTSTSTTAPSNPDVNNTISALAKGISSAYSPGKSLYQAPGSNTTGGQSAALTAANNPLYGSSVNGAIKSFGDVAAGNQFGQNSPGYAQLRQKAMDDAITGVGSAFTNSGRFGGGSYVDQATTSAANAAAGLDYQNYQNDIARQQQAASMLPGLFNAAQLPASVQQGVGAQQDANASAQANGPTDYLAKLTAISTGNAGAAGQTQTNTQPGVPWWQQVLGAGAIGAGIYGSVTR